MPANVANGSSVTEPRRSQIIHYLAEGFSVHFIASRFRMGEHTVKAVRDIEWQRIADKKPILKALHERNAMLALTELGKRVDQTPDKLTPTELNMIAGTSTDKALVLGGDANFIMRHEYFLRLGDEDLYGFALARSKQAKATVVEDSPPMLTNGDATTLQDCNNDNPVMNPSSHVASQGKGKRTAKGTGRPQRRSVARKKSIPAD